MTVVALSVNVAPDPVAIAQRLEGRPGLALLHGAADSEYGQRSFVAADPVERSAARFPGPNSWAASPIGSPATPRRACDTRGAVPRWIGVIPYECARDLERRAWTRFPENRAAPHIETPVWWRYGAVVEIDPRAGTVRVVGDDGAKVAELARALDREPLVRREGRAVRVSPLGDEDPPEAHVERVRRAKQLIAAGDLYQVNLARRSRLAVEGAPLDVYAAIIEQAPASFGACLDLGEVVVVASSPELFLDVDAASGRVVTAPIKGTRPRGADADEDRVLARALDESAKERAELTMILDVERNDLGRVSRPGSVRLLTPPRVQTHRTIHHRAAEIAGTLAEGVTPLDLLLSTFPSGSVTGAPKVRAMEVIAQLEPVRRGLYTGAFGYVSLDGSLRLAMAIRVLTLRAGEGHYYAGGGIVADSDPDLELEETYWKSTQIERLVGPGSASSRTAAPQRGVSPEKLA